MCAPEAVYARIRQEAEVQPFWRGWQLGSWKLALAAGLGTAAVLIGVYSFDQQPVDEEAQAAVKSAALSRPRTAPAARTASRTARRSGMRLPVDGWVRRMTVTPRAVSRGIASIRRGPTSASDE